MSLLLYIVMFCAVASASEDRLVLGVVREYPSLLFPSLLTVALTVGM
jgi:hypothetical protein